MNYVIYALCGVACAGIAYVLFVFCVAFRRVRIKNRILRGIERALQRHAEERSNILRLYENSEIDHDTLIQRLTDINLIVDSEITNILNLRINSKKDSNNVSQEYNSSELAKVSDNHRFGRDWYERVRRL